MNFAPKSYMKHFLLSATFCVAFSFAAWHSLTSTLDQMTASDCQAGIVKACEALK
jgi:hypothetical protein